MFLGYPGSGQMSKFDVEHGSTRSIVKNAACGNNSALAKAVLTDANLKELILVGIINEIKKEIRLYAKDPECLLKLKTPRDIRNFSNESLYQQLLVKCPKLAVIIGSISQPGNIKGKLPDLLAESSHRFQNSVCMATSICLHQYNQQMSATHYRISLLLLNGGAKAVTLERCSHLGISMSHSSAIRMQSKAAAPSSTKVTTWKEDTLAKSLQVNLIKEVLKKQPSTEVNFGQDVLDAYDYFEEGVHHECCTLLQKTGSSLGNEIYPREVLNDTVGEIKKDIVHYK